MDPRILLIPHVTGRGELGKKVTSEGETRKLYSDG